MKRGGGKGRKGYDRRGVSKGKRGRGSKEGTWRGEGECERREGVH